MVESARPVEGDLVISGSRITAIGPGAAAPADAVLRRGLLHHGHDARREPHRSDREHARPCTGQRRPERTGSASGRDDLAERRDKARARGLVQTVVHRERQQRAVRAQHRGDERRCMRQIEDGVGARYLIAQDRARFARFERRARHVHADAPGAREGNARRDRAAIVGERDGHPAVQRCGDVVGVTLDLARHAQQRASIERFTQERVRRDRPANDRSGARAKPPCDGDGGALLDVLRREIRTGCLCRGTRAHDEEVVFADRHTVPFDVHGPRAGGAHLELGEQR